MLLQSRSKQEVQSPAHSLALVTNSEQKSLFPQKTHVRAYAGQFPFDVDSKLSLGPERIGNGHADPVRRGRFLFPRLSALAGGIHGVRPGAFSNSGVGRTNPATAAAARIAGRCAQRSGNWGPLPAGLVDGTPCLLRAKRGSSLRGLLEGFPSGPSGTQVDSQGHASGLNRSRRPQRPAMVQIDKQVSGMAIRSRMASRLLAIRRNGWLLPGRTAHARRCVQRCASAPACSLSASRGEQQ